MSELTAQEQERLEEVGRRLQEHLSALTAGWERSLDNLLAAESARKALRQESVAAAYALIRTIAEGRPAEGWQEGRKYGAAMAAQNLGHTVLSDWLATLRQSLLTVLSQIYADDPHLDQAIVAFSKFFALYMLHVTESFSHRQQQLLLEQQQALRRAYEEAQRRVVELEVLNEVGQAIASTMDMDSLLLLIYQQTSRLMDTTNFFIALCDWEKEELNFALFVEEGERQPHAPRPITAGLSGYIARTGQPLLCPRGPDEFLKERGLERVGRPSKSWLGVPMRAQERVIGVIAVQSYTQEGAYDEGHLRILSTIAAQAAVALENARLYHETRRRVEEMEALWRIGVASGSHLRLEEILQSIYEQASVVMDTSAFFVALYDREADEVRFELDYEKGVRAEPTRYSKSELGGLTGWILDHGQPLLIRDWEQEATEELRRIAVQVGEMPRSWLGVPMLMRGQTVGVIAAQSYQAGAFDEHHLQVLEMIAHQAAAAIESARLYQEAQRRVAQLGALQEVGLKLATTTDMAAVLATIAEAVLSLLQANDVLIFLYDAARQSFTLGTALRDTGERDFAIPMPRPNGLTATVARSGQILAIDDASNHPLYADMPGQARGLKSIVGAPLIRSGQVLGVLNVSYYTHHHFTPDELRLLQSLSDQAAVAVSNAQLFQQMQAVMQELQATTATQSELLDLIHELSTPVVPILSGVLLMPLIGSIDSQRGRQILERLLQEVERQGARVVLMDITGVPVVDTAVAQMLLQAVQATQLLGGEAVLVGIRPEVAQTLVGLGVDLSGITTRSDLQGGVAYALRRIGQQRSSLSRGALGAGA